MREWKKKIQGMEGRERRARGEKAIFVESVRRNK
jgi:hypothetical protein